jgi:hypothetical protein
MTEKIEHATREQIATFLPSALQKAIDFYLSIKMEEETKEKKRTSKDYKEYHDACKVGLAHIKLLLELAQWADLPRDVDEDENLSELIETAQGELNKNV